MDVVELFLFEDFGSMGSDFVHWEENGLGVVSVFGLVFISDVDYNSIELFWVDSLDELVASDFSYKVEFLSIGFPVLQASLKVLNFLVDAQLGEFISSLFDLVTLTNDDDFLLRINELSGKVLKIGSKGNIDALSDETLREGLKVSNVNQLTVSIIQG